MIVMAVYGRLPPVNEKPEDLDFNSIQERIHQYWSKTKQKPRKVAQYKAQQAYPMGQGLMQFSGKAKTQQARLPISKKSTLIWWIGAAELLEKIKKAKYRKS